MPRLGRAFAVRHTPVAVAPDGKAAARKFLQAHVSHFLHSRHAGVLSQGGSMRQSGADLVPLLLTPIIWTSDKISSHTMLLDLNPFYHLIEIFRGPLLDEWPRPISWWAVVVGIAVGWPLALYVLARFRDRIPFLV